MIISREGGNVNKKSFDVVIIKCIFINMYISGEGGGVNRAMRGIGGQTDKLPFISIRERML